MQTESGESITKLEKADVLELTLKHLQDLQRKNKMISPSLHHSKGGCPQEIRKQYFHNGYKACAAEVSQYLSTFPSLPTSAYPLHHQDTKPSPFMDIHFGTSLMSHLGKRLQSAEMDAFLPHNQPQRITSPPTNPAAFEPLSVVTTAHYPHNQEPSNTMYHGATTSNGSSTTLYKSSSYSETSKMKAMAPPSHYSLIIQPPSSSTTSMSSSSDCGYSSGRDSVSPSHSSTTAISPSSGQAPASPKINVEDLEEDMDLLSPSGPLNLVNRPHQQSRVNHTSSESVWRPF